MRRKSFIKNTAIIVTGLVTPFGKLRGRNLIVNDAQAIWSELIEYARWSPSPHNVQPWKIKVISNTEANLYYDPSRLLIYTDPTSCFTIAGMSMFIECLNIAANFSKYKLIATHEPEQRLDYNAKSLQLFAKLTLLENDIEGLPDRQLIKQRKTSRLHYDGKVLRPDIVKSLTSVASDYGFYFNHSSDPEMIAYIMKLNEETLFYDIDDDNSRVELGKLIRTTPGQAEQKKDGLWNKCMRFPGWLMHDFFFHHERFDSKWKRRILGNVYLKSMSGTANVCWISGKFTTRADWVTAGTMFQRLWLQMTKYNVYLHPFGSVITNPAAHKKFKERVNHSDTNGQLWILARMGYSHQPPRSFRLETKDILLPA